MEEHVRTLKELDYVERSETILIGYEIGSAETEHGRLSVVASGNTVRFMLNGVDGHVDLKINNFAGAALAWLAARKNAEVVT